MVMCWVVFWSRAPREVKLVLGGEVLDPKRSLGEYDLDDGDVLTAVAVVETKAAEAPRFDFMEARRRPDGTRTGPRLGPGWAQAGLGPTWDRPKWARAQMITRSDQGPTAWARASLTRPSNPPQNHPHTCKSCVMAIQRCVCVC